MIVDYDLGVLDTLRGVLPEEGFPVVLANNGVAALYLQRTLVSLVIGDFMMRHISGPG
jgi:CheY-like chemotaxis protein